MAGSFGLSLKNMLGALSNMFERRAQAHSIYILYCFTVAGQEGLTAEYDSRVCFGGMIRGYDSL